MSGRLPHRSPLLWALALLLTLGCWGALLAGALDARGGVGMMFAGGWTLSLLPVHSARFRRRGPRPPGGSSAQAGPRLEAVVRAWSDGIRRLRKGR
ncbi:hypothetical protein [Streptacidiphilus sp. PAMC 29251]